MSCRRTDFLIRPMKTGRIGKSILRNRLPMATIIRAADAPHDPHAVAFNFDDLVAQANQYVDRARIESAEIVAQAEDQADAIRQQAAEEGRQAALAEVEQIVARQIAPALAALRQATGDLQQAKQAWLSHWEASAVHVAGAIAAKVIRQELTRQPEITLTLIREALELAAGSPSVRLRLNPDDHQALGAQVRMLIDTMSALGSTEVTADAAISPGGCRVETRFGTIDQQFESQLSRIEEELIGGAMSQ
jgi:flagellar assembly protein FliH